MLNKIVCCDALEGLKKLSNNSVHMACTSPPYWGLRNYKVGGQLGLEKTPDEYVNNLVNIFNELWRVLRDDGVVWLNIGDTMSNYKDQSVRHQTVAGHSRDEPANGLATNRDGKILKECGLKNKELVGIPHRVVFALQKAGWYLRSEIIWAKGISFCPNYSGSCMPESVNDRPTRSHEYIFLLTKQPHYFYDKEAIMEEGVYPAGTKAAKGSGEREGNRRGEGYAVYNGKRNPRSVWAIKTKPYREAHFATFPEALVEPWIKAGTSEKGCCSICGNPYKRIIAKRSFPKVEASKLDRYGTGKAGVHRRVGGQYTKWLNANPPITTGWEKTCNCKDSKIIPCTVLDFFMGSGTSAVVAKKLGRNFIGFELNPEYCKIGEKRLNQLQMELKL